MLKMKWKFIALKMRWLQIKREHVQDKSGWGLLIRKWCPGNLRDPNVKKHPQFWMERNRQRSRSPPWSWAPTYMSCLPCSCPAFQLGESLDNVNLFLNEHLSDPLPLESPKYEIMWIFLAVPSRVCERWVHTLHQYHSSRPGGSFTRIWNWPNLEYLRKLF